MDNQHKRIPVDGFSEEEIEQMVLDSIAQARCTECGDEMDVEPDAHGYDCQSCGAAGSVTSPLVKLGLI